MTTARLVRDHLASKVRLMPATEDEFLLLAGEVGTWRGPLIVLDRRRRDLLDRLQTLTRQIAVRDTVREANVFRGILRPPGEGTRLLRRRGVRPARYDVVVLVRTPATEGASALRNDPTYRAMVDAMRTAARRTYEIAARNAARIADVDHRPDHAFLFNYFYADDTDTLLKVWEYTAGWFQARTGLPNSTLLRPLDGEASDYGIVNHASWPNLRSFVPSLILRPTFRRFVLANFKANGIAAQPIIYRRQRPSSEGAGSSQSAEGEFEEGAR